MKGNRQLWSMHQVASLLSSLGPKALITTILAPTTAARLISLVRQADCTPSFAPLCPEWVYDATAIDSRFKDYVIVGRQGAFDPWQGQVVGAGGAVRYLVNQPMSILFATGHERFHSRTVLPVIDALNVYRSSSALVLGSGSVGMTLLNSCEHSSHLLPDIVIFDLSQSTWFQPALAVSPDAVRAALPDHVPVEHGSSQPATGRFLVLSRPDGSGLGPNSKLQDELAECLTVGRVYAAESRWVEGANRLAWTGHAPGIKLLVERPGQSKCLSVSLLSSATEGINFFVNGSRMRPNLSCYQPGQLGPIHLMFESNVNTDELAEVTIAPVRLSTTARPERLEIAALSFLND